jgi:hypothetical protein
MCHSLCVCLPLLARPLSRAPSAPARLPFFPDPSPSPHSRHHSAAPLPTAVHAATPPRPSPSPHLTATPPRPSTSPPHRTPPPRRAPPPLLRIARRRRCRIARRHHPHHSTLPLLLCRPSPPEQDASSSAILSLLRPTTPRLPPTNPNPSLSSSLARSPSVVHPRSPLSSPSPQSRRRRFPTVSPPGGWMHVRHRLASTGSRATQVWMGTPAWW